MIKGFINKDHHADQEMEQLIAGNNSTKKKKEKIQREERLATVVRRHGTIPPDEYLRGIAHNLHFSSRNVNNYVVEDNFSDREQEFQTSLRYFNNLMVLIF